MSKEKYYKQTKKKNEISLYDLREMDINLGIICGQIIGNCVLWAMDKRDTQRDK